VRVLAKLILGYSLFRRPGAPAPFLREAPKLLIVRRVANLTLQWLTKALSVGFSPATVRDAPELDSLRDKPKFKKHPGR
jgi:hypothetical protein